MPTDDGKTLIVAEERTNGNVKIYDISNDQSAERPGHSDAEGNAQYVERVPPRHVHYRPTVRTTCTCMAICCFCPGTKQDCRCSTSPTRPARSIVGAFDTWPGTSTNFNGNWGVDLSLGLNRVLLSDRKRGLIVVDASGVRHPGRLQPGHGRRTPTTTTCGERVRHDAKQRTRRAARRRQLRRHRRRGRLRRLARSLRPSPNRRRVGSRWLDRAGAGERFFCSRSAPV